MDTIFALSSGALPAGVAVVRFSGAGSRQALEALAGSLPEPRRASLRTLRDSDGEAIDQALIVWMPGPSSFTGEDCAEIHCHGSRAVIARLVESVAERDGLRGAEPGEFARRAFLNGRIDLTEAEGLGDLIGAETEAQRRQALAQAGGAMAGQLASWRERLVGLLGEAEAGLDFADEADVAEGLSATFWKDLQSLADEIGEVLAGATFAERVREGFRIVIAGPPNAGKSTLLNAFARRDVAIVSPEAGTTRDLVSVELSLGGYPVTLVDTAGLRETPSEAESLGVARARKAAEAADLVLRLSEGRPHFGEGSESDWMVETKADVAGGPCGELGARRFRISAVTGVGLAELEGALGAWLKRQADAGGAAGTAPVNARQRAGISSLSRRIESVLERKGDPTDELLVEDLRACVTAVGRITGRVDAEEILDAVFGKFCIGK